MSLFENKQSREDNRRFDSSIAANERMEDNRNAYEEAIASEGTYLHQAEERKDLTRWQQDLADELFALRHDLLREVYDEKSDSWVREVEVVSDGNGGTFKVDAKPLVNAYGFYKIQVVVKRYLSRNMMMTNLSEKIINRMLYDLLVKLFCNFSHFWEAYEIEKGDIQIVVKLIMDSVEGTLYRAYNNGERNYLNTINKRVEAFTQSGRQMPDQKKSWLTSFGG